MAMAGSATMLEHVPQWLGESMRNLRAGHAKLAIVQPELGVSTARIDLASPAFANGGRLPDRFTADGEGVSPPLLWTSVPAEADMLALIVEDPDAPAMQPLVHAILWDLPAGDGRLGEGAIVADGAMGTADVGRNSAFREGWLPPDPPTGHGTHDYVFQLFALRGAGDAGDNPGRSAMLKAMTGHVVAAGLLVGTYSRGEAAPVGADSVGVVASV